MTIAKNGRKKAKAPAASKRTDGGSRATARPGGKSAGKALAAKGKTAGTAAARGKDGDDDEGSGRSTSLGLEIDAEVLEFIAALDEFKKANNRQFPSWSEVLFVLKELGYRKR
ncbi:MAG: hypothetical protein AB7O97_20630 [Planctomycetota bacterium]